MQRQIRFFGFGQSLNKRYGFSYYADLSEQEVIEFQTHYLSEEGEIMRLAQILRQEGRQE